MDTGNGCTSVFFPHNLKTSERKTTLHSRESEIRPRENCSDSLQMMIPLWAFSKQTSTIRYHWISNVEDQNYHQCWGGGPKRVG